jgi:hypothetical protein
MHPGKQYVIKIVGRELHLLFKPVRTQKLLRLNLQHRKLIQVALEKARNKNLAAMAGSPRNPRAVETILGGASNMFAADCRS